ncbi:MAG: hypothetical protein ACC656_09335 [Candidatus Heimdallarchaeota archaeon]
MNFRDDDRRFVRKIRMFKKRVKSLDIYEEAKKKNQRTWNIIDE